MVNSSTRMGLTKNSSKLGTCNITTINIRFKDNSLTLPIGVFWNKFSIDMPVRGDNSLYFATGLDNSGLIQGTGEAADIVQDLGDRISKINPFGKLAGTAITLFFGIAAAAAKMVADYEREMDKVRAISNQTATEFDQVRKQIFSLSEDTPTTPRELAQAYYEIVSAGYEGAEAITLLKQANDNSVAGFVKSADSAERLVNILSTYNKDVSEAADVSDKLFAAAEIGGLKFDELSKNMDKIAPVAQNFNIPFEQVLAAVVALTEQGVPVSKAINIIKTSLQKTTDVLGAGYTELYTYEEAMAEVFERAGGSDAKLKEMLGSFEAVNGVLSTTGENAGRVADIMDQLNDSQGRAAEASLRVAETSGKQWTLLRNRIRSTLELMGTGTLRLMDDLAESINIVTKDYNKQSRALIENRQQLGRLVFELEDTNTEEKRKAEILGIISRQYKQYLPNIDIEKTKLSELLPLLKQVNEAFVERIAVQKLIEENTKADEEAADALVDKIKARTEFNNLLFKIQQKTGIEANKELGIREQALEVARKLNEQDADFIAGGTLGGGIVDASKGIKILADDLLDAEEAYERLNEAARKTREENQGAIDATINFDVGDDQKLSTTVEEQLQQIAESKTRLELAPFLESDNERIKVAAQERLKFLRQLNNPDDDAESYAEFLSRQIQAYEEFYASLRFLSDEEAEAEFAKLNERGRNTEEFLQNELEKAETFAQKRDIALAADNAGVSLDNKNQKIEITPIISLAEIDSTSINSLTKRLQKLEEDFNAALSQGERESIGAKIRILQRQIDEAEKAAQAEFEIFKDLQFDLEDLSIRSLRKRRDETIKSFDDILKDFRGTAEERQQILDEFAETMDAINREIGEKFEQNADILAQALGDIGDIFTTFGNEDLGELFGQIQDVVKGVGTLGKGLASNNPFAIIGGIAEIVKGGISVEIVSDTAKFEAAIKRLERSVEQLDYAISQSIGNDRIESRRELIEAQKELEELALQAAEAEEKARKETKFLGITIGRKGEGSGTDPEKVAELEQQAEEARRKVEELNTEIQELFTGTTEKSIVDSIIDGFSQGKRSIQDFASTFEELMRNAVLESLKIKYLEKDIEKFFEEFADAAETGSGLDSQEVNALRELFNRIITDNEQRLNALNEILGEAGIASQGITDRQGLAGEISTITEDTANVLAGTLNTIRITAGDQLDAAIEANLYLAGIQSNTAEALPFMEDMSTRLRNIEKLLG